MMTSHELRSRYLSFFGERAHIAIPSASLVPINDPTVLFTTAGMHPLVPNLLGESHPAGTRLVNVQKCVRTGDIDQIGDDTHLTLFEMLGNWSLGDYGKRDAIRWSFEFLTGALQLPLARLGATCFHDDHESLALWQEHGMPGERLQRLGEDDNWWGPVGATGPCGPDTEIFYWVGDEPPPETLDVRDRRWVEIWNNVFMSFTKTATGELAPLPRGNVDTGMGVERTLVALGGLRSVYEVDTVAPIVRALDRPDGRALRIVVDHVRAAQFLIADGVLPANKDRGYVLRRLLRRALVLARQLALPDDWYVTATRAVTGALGDVYPELARDPVPVIAEEAQRFGKTLAHGLRALGKQRRLDGTIAFDLFQTYGFPIELTRELAREQGMEIDEDDVRAQLERHRERSRTSTGFTGGLADHSADVVRYHTLTHLLQAALRRVLGDHVIQRGSNITRERLRFDFSHDHALTRDELARVEALVNGWIARELAVERAVMSEPEARALGALAAFGERYGDVVSVYTITDARTGEVVSRELCGGPHVAAGTELHGAFQISREQAVAAGVRRIRATFRGGAASQAS